jgi:tetratricopeptide (TPR) repeat protein
VLRFEWNRAEAGREHQRSVQLDPNYVTGRQWLASQYWTEGRFAEALDQLEQAAALDPLSPVIALNRGRHFYYTRDYDRAEEALRRALVLDRGNLIAGQLLALVYCARGDRTAALAQLRQSPAPPGAWLAVAGYVRGVSGDTAGAQQILAELDVLARRRYIPAYAFATVHAGLGDTARALDFLDRAADERSAYLDYLHVEPTLDRLRGELRFGQLLRRVNLSVVPSAKRYGDARPSS